MAYPAAAAVIVLTACGGGSSSGPPSTPTTPSPPTSTPSNTWSIAGQVIDTVGRQGIGGAQVAPTWDLAAATAASDGSYSLGAVTNPPTTPYRLGVSAAGYVTRELWVQWQRGPRTGVTLDLIRDSPPFSMTFYRQLVRDDYDEPGDLAPVLRWMEPPRFYLRTVDQNGRAIEPEVLAVVREALGRAVPAFTGGRFSATIESGTETRPETTGWINVDIVRNPNERRTCGTSFVGRNPGLITLNNDVCSCGSNKVPGALVVHEVGHALGFFHVGDRNSVMFPFLPGNCPSGQLSAAESYHSAIAYSRPRGNADPDVDPPAPAFVTAPAILVER